MDRSVGGSDQCALVEDAHNSKLSTVRLSLYGRPEPAMRAERGTLMLLTAFLSPSDRAMSCVDDSAQESNTGRRRFRICGLTLPTGAASAIAHNSISSTHNRAVPVVADMACTVKSKAFRKMSRSRVPHPSSSRILTLECRILLPARVEKVTMHYRPPLSNLKSKRSDSSKWTLNVALVVTWASV